MRCAGGLVTGTPAWLDHSFPQASHVMLSGMGLDLLSLRSAAKINKVVTGSWYLTCSWLGQWAEPLPRQGVHKSGFAYCTHRVQ